MADYTLLTPGPVPLPQEILDLLAEPPLHHRTPEFEAILSRTLKGLSVVFQTQEPVHIFSSTGTGAMEAAIVNTLSPGDKVIALISGKFGQRWNEISKAYRLSVIPYEIPWGEAAQAEKLQELLEKNPDCRAILCQACETSTGTLHPIKKLAAIVAKAPNTLMIVDAITALGAIHLPMDEWQLDVVIAGSQKALMLPTGLSFIAFSQKAWSAVEKSQLPKYYFDVKKERASNKKNQTAFSSSVSLIRALDHVVSQITQRGLDFYCRQVEQRSKALAVLAHELNLPLFSQSPSPSVVAFAIPPQIDSQELRTRLEIDHKVVVMGGQDQLKGKILRIGTMGAIKEGDFLKLAQALTQTLSAMDVQNYPSKKTDAAFKTFSKYLRENPWET